MIDNSTWFCTAYSKVSVDAIYLVPWVFMIREALLALSLDMEDIP